MAKLDLGFASTDWVVVRIGSLPDLLALQNELERGRIPVRIQLPEFHAEGPGVFAGEPTLYVPRTHVEDAERVARGLDPTFPMEVDSQRLDANPPAEFVAPRLEAEPLVERGEPRLDLQHAAARVMDPDESTSTPSAAAEDTDSAQHAGGEFERRSATTAMSSSSAPPDAELERTRALARRIRYCMPSLVLAPVCLVLAPRYLHSPRRRDLMKTERWTTDVAVALALPASLLAVALLWMLVEELAPLRDLFR